MEDFIRKYNTEDYLKREDVYNKNIKDLEQKIEMEELTINKIKADYENEYRDLLDKYNLEKDKIENFKNIINLYKDYTIKSKKIFEIKKNKDTNNFEKEEKIKNKVIEKNKKAVISMSLIDNQIEIYKKLNMKKADKIIELRSQIKYIKNKNSTEVSKLNNEMNIIKNEQIEIENIYKNEYSNLKNIFNIKNNEYNNLKFIGKTILFQKYVINKFITDSIEEVKTLIDNTLDTKEKTNYEEKLKILRLFYNRINIGTVPKAWKRQFNNNKI